ncbi:MAG TPA: class I SAM-dependent methyltransferase [Candidatus Tectomicrobia bacterium]|jgi:SAM-dependent methyltransferase
MERCDHHDWTSDAYVEAWVQRQQDADPARVERFWLLCDLCPFPTDATVTILDVGAGYGPVSKFILDHFPNATCIAQDGSTPMLQRAQQRLAGYGARFAICQSDLFAQDWLPTRYGPFDAVVSARCLHNLRDFRRISAIYGDIRAQLKPGGVFLNFDLVKAPSLALQQCYGRVIEARRQREDTPRVDLDAAVQHASQTPAHGQTHGFPASLDEHLAALKAAGFVEVDCFWKDLRNAIYGGYV